MLWGNEMGTWGYGVRMWGLWGRVWDCGVMGLIVGLGVGLWSQNVGIWG